jgi:hypothetical protein
VIVPPVALAVSGRFAVSAWIPYSENVEPERKVLPTATKVIEVTAFVLRHKPTAEITSPVA